MAWRRFTKAMAEMARALMARLRELASANTEPVNYQSLVLSPTLIEYVDLAGERHRLPFHEMSKVEFVREEALFPCLDGPYLETKWLIHTVDGTRTEVMDETPHRKNLVQAFAQHLAGFDSDAAAEGLNSTEAGRWLCHPVQAS